MTKKEKKRESAPPPGPPPPCELSSKALILKCAYCGTLNPIDTTRCIHCNVSLKDVKPSYEANEE